MICYLKKATIFFFNDDGNFIQFQSFDSYYVDFLMLFSYDFFLTYLDTLPRRIENYRNFYICYFSRLYINWEFCHIEAPFSVFLFCQMLDSASASALYSHSLYCDVILITYVTVACIFDRAIDSVLSLKDFLVHF